MKTQLTLRMPGQIPSSFHLNLLGICLCLVTACSVFKEKSFFETDSLQKQETKREIKTRENSQSQALRIYSLEDSSDKRSFTEIFPEGLFSYSPEAGFSGNAKRVIINERIKKGSKLRNSARLLQTSNKSSDLRESRRSLAKTRLKEKEINAANLSTWYLLGIILLFAGIYLFRGKLQQISN